jgi:hypothetical protein
MALDAATLRAKDTFEYLQHLAAQHEDDRLLGEVLGAYSALAQAVEEEAANLLQG